MPKGEAYSEDEDLFLTMAWIAVSEDPITGAEQKGDQFWVRIRDKFHDLWKTRRGEDRAFALRVSGRTSTALKNRWGTRISHDCQKFSSYYQRVIALNQSGQTTEDRITAAQKMFQEDISWNDTKREFTHLSCWEILKSHPKWSFGPPKRKLEKLFNCDTTSIDDESEDSVSKNSEMIEIPGESPRPPGRKRMKREKFTEENRERDRERGVIAATLRVAEVAERKASAIELLSEIHHAALFGEDSGCTAEERKEYYTLMRQKVLRKMKADANNAGLNGFLLNCEIYCHRVIIANS